MFLTNQIAQNELIYFTCYTANFAYHTANFITIFLCPFYCNYSSSKLHASVIFSPISTIVQMCNRPGVRALVRKVKYSVIWYKTHLSSVCDCLCGLLWMH